MTVQTLTSIYASTHMRTSNFPHTVLQGSVAFEEGHVRFEPLRSSDAYDPCLCLIRLDVDLFWAYRMSQPQPIQMLPAIFMVSRSCARRITRYAYGIERAASKSFRSGQQSDLISHAVLAMWRE